MKDSRTSATRLVVLIPAFNEEATVADVAEQCGRLREAYPALEVVVVNDGSSDRTAEVAEAAGATVVSHRINRGVGRAFRTGLDAALRRGAEVIVNVDADGQFDPARIPELVAPILEGKADFVTASRFKDPALVPEMPWIKRWGNHMMSLLVSRITGRSFCDVSCGFRAYNREAALRLNLWGEFTYTQETFLDLAVKGMSIVEVPMKIRGVRQHGESKVAASVWLYGRKTSRIIFHSFRDYWPMPFFGLISLFFLVPGSCLVLFLLVHRLLSGAFSPHIWAGLTGGSLAGAGLLVLVVGLVGQMLKRIRLNQEQLLYFHRKQDLADSVDST